MAEPVSGDRVERIAATIAPLFKESGQPVNPSDLVAHVLHQAGQLPPVSGRDERVRPGSDEWAARQAAFHRGWQMAMELVAQEAEADDLPVPSAAVEALLPCEHDSVTGDFCDWCAERVDGDDA
jgi:hypothetical protein